MLLIPLVMTIVDRNKPEGDGWHWRPGGFVVVGALLFGAGFVYEFLASKMNSRALKLALGLAMTFSEIGRAHVWTPVTNAHLVCRLLLTKKNKRSTHT